MTPRGLFKGISKKTVTLTVKEAKVGVTLEKTKPCVGPSQGMKWEFLCRYRTRRESKASISGYLKSALSLHPQKCMSPLPARPRHHPCLSGKFRHCPVWLTKGQPLTGGRSLLPGGCVRNPCVALSITQHARPSVSKRLLPPLWLRQ